jgi:hypothetical protein
MVWRYPIGPALGREQGLTASLGGHTQSAAREVVPMTVLLYVVIPFVALLAAGVIYDLNRRRRGTAAYDVGPGMRAARADAEARRIPGGH